MKVNNQFLSLWGGIWPHSLSGDLRSPLSLVVLQPRSSILIF